MGRKIFKFELKRCFSGRSFAIALLVGVGIVVFHFFQILIFYNWNVTGVLCENAENGWIPLTVFNRWILMIVDGWLKEVFLYLVPLIAVLPYAASYHGDIKSGYINQITTRGGRKAYLVSKYSVVFLSGLLALAIPIVLDMLMLMALFPVGQIFMYSNYYSGDSGSLWGKLFWEHTWVYAGVFTLIVSGLGGLAGCLALTVSRILENRFLISLFPVLFLTFYSSLIEAFGWYNLSFQGIIDIYAGYNVEVRSTLFFVGLSAVMFGITFLPYYMMGKKQDSLK